MRALVVCLFLLGLAQAVPVEGPGPLNELDLPVPDPYQPEKAPNIPIELGSRSKFLVSFYNNSNFGLDYFSGCDNIYHGAIMPCLLRPELPPFSYSTERYYNMEYKKK